MEGPWYARFNGESIGTIPTLQTWLDDGPNPGTWEFTGPRDQKITITLTERVPTLWNATFIDGPPATEQVDTPETLTSGDPAGDWSSIDSFLQNIGTAGRFTLSLNQQPSFFIGIELHR